MSRTVRVLLRPLTRDGEVVGAELLPVGITAYEALDSAWRTVNGRPLNGVRVKVYGAQCAHLLRSQPSVAIRFDAARGKSVRVTLNQSDIQEALRNDGGTPALLLWALAVPPGQESFVEEIEGVEGGCEEVTP